MFAKNVLALSGAFIAAVAAVPMANEPHHHHYHNRDLVWETVIDEVFVTVPVTKTVWIEPGETPPPSEPAPQSSTSASSTPNAEAAAYTPPAAAAPAPAAYTPPVQAPPAPAYTPETTTSSSSVYVAPAYTPPPSSSSVYVAPAPPAWTPSPSSSSSVYVAPTPESTYVAPAPVSSYVAPAPVSSAAPAASSSAPSSGGSYGGKTLSYGMAKAGTSYSGDLTYFTPGLGACGITSGEQDHMVAISEVIFDAYNGANPNNNPLCGMTVDIVGADGTTYPATIWDRCPGCDESSLDLPQSFFDLVTTNPETKLPADGRAHNVNWSFPS